MQHAIIASMSALVLVVGAANALGADDPVRASLTIRDHRFEPAELLVPANTPVLVEVRNEDTTAEEFESATLGVEKVIAGGRQTVVRLRPLSPGRYAFIGEYHADTAIGTVVAAEGK